MTHDAYPVNLLIELLGHYDAVMDRLEPRLPCKLQRRNAAYIRKRYRALQPELRGLLAIFLKQLSRRDLVIIKARYCCQQTLSATGKQLGISGERVRQLQGRIKQRLLEGPENGQLLLFELFWPDNRPAVVAEALDGGRRMALWLCVLTLFDPSKPLEAADDYAARLAQRWQQLGCWPLVTYLFRIKTTAALTQLLKQTQLWVNVN